MAELAIPASSEHLERYRQIIEEMWDCAGNLHNIHNYCSGWKESTETTSMGAIQTISKKDEWEGGLSGVKVTIIIRRAPSGFRFEPTLIIESW